MRSDGTPPVSGDGQSLRPETRIILESLPVGTLIVDDEGITPEKLDYVFELKNVRRGRIKEYADEYPSAVYHEGVGLWNVPVDKVELVPES